MSVPFFGPLNLGKDQSKGTWIQLSFEFGPEYNPEPSSGGGTDTRPPYGQALPRWNKGGRQP